MYRILLSDRAERELVLSWEWYEERQEGLGYRFIEEFRNKVKKIEHNPELYAIKFSSYRETIIPDFPLLIIYRISKRKRVVRIVSIFHTSRSTFNKYRG